MQPTIANPKSSHPTTGLLARRRFLTGAAALSAAAIAPGAWAASRPLQTRTSSVSVDRRGDTLYVEAQADVAATSALTFATLADYDHLAEFIPGLASSRTVSREGLKAVVEQRGQAAFGPFEQRFTVTLSVEEDQDATIRASLAGGDFRRFDAVYEIQSTDAATTRVVYRAELEPTAAIPPLFGLRIMRGVIRSQFEAMIAEIGRRSAA